jgi:flagellar motility protein MotE (MotC chaperone)
MDAGAAAKIFEELGDGKIDLVVDTLKNMNNKNAAQILEEMNENYAAKVTEKLSEKYGIVLE